ncbi:MAG: hypothetical protein MR922_01020 [Lachnospiraceae bacterium]|nr:hypothetical protein [Lachnospiraceae bacterium]
MDKQEYQLKDIKLYQKHLGAVAMAFLTAFIGAYKPVKIAAQLSTIEALKFSEYGYYHKIKTTKYSPIKLKYLIRRNATVLGDICLA